MSTKWARVGGAVCLIAAMIVVPAAGLWAAEPAPPPEKSLLGDRFGFDAGLKLWVAKWQPGGFANGINASRTSDTTTMVGPSLTGTVRLRDEEWLNSLSVNFTWLEAGGFDFSPLGFNNGGTGSRIDQTSAIRRDYSLVAALSIWRGFGVFAGYYHMQQRFSSQYFGNITGAPKESVWISGPFIGVFGSGVVAGPLKSYGNLAVGFYDEKSNSTGQNRTTANGVQGYSAEFGLALDGPSLKTGMGKIGSAFQMGFRAQIINVNNSPLANNDVTWGPTFQFTARF